MKLLCAIECKDNIDKLDLTLRWASRSGYALQLFVPTAKITEYANAVADANYHWYLALDPEGNIMGDTDPMKYAQVMGYDLLLRVPEGLELWRRGRNFQLQVFFFSDSVGRSRLKFSQKPKMRIKRWPNGAIMERVRKL